MPKARKDGSAREGEIPETLERSNQKAQDTFAQTYDSAMDTYDGDESRAARTAWAAVKRGHEKVGDHWEAKDEAGEDEEASAQLAERTLTDLLPAAEVAEVARLVRLTAGHAPALGDARGEVLCDADLSILGRDVARYDVYRRDVRREYADVPLPEYRRGRAAVLRHLAGLQPLYRTPAGRELWSAQAEANLDRELSLFEAP